MKTRTLTDTDRAILDRLSGLRKKKNKTRKEVCDDLGGLINEERLKSYELEKRYSEPSPEHLVALANYYGVSIDYILGRADADPAAKYGLSANSVGLSVIRALYEESSESLEKTITLKTKDGRYFLHLLMNAIDSINNHELNRERLSSETNMGLHVANETDSKDKIAEISRAFTNSCDGILNQRAAIIYSICMDLNNALIQLLPDAAIEELLNSESIKIIKSIPSDIYKHL